MVRKVLLFCGILSSLLYVGTDIVAAMRYEGYSYTSQTISELSAIGAPTRSLIIPLYITYDLLLIAFAVGVWASAGENRALRVTAGLLAGIGILPLVAPFPMNVRGTERTLTDTLHLLVAGITVLLILLAMGFGANAFGRWFRAYSIGSILTALVFGVVTGFYGPAVAANQPTPWVGILERIILLAYVLWVAVLAINLLRGREAATRDKLVRRHSRLALHHPI